MYKIDAGPPSPTAMRAKTAIGGERRTAAGRGGGAGAGDRGKTNGGERKKIHRLRNRRFSMMEGIPMEIRFSCGVCGVSPIPGTRYRCIECPVATVRGGGTEEERGEERGARRGRGGERTEKRGEEGIRTRTTEAVAPAATGEGESRENNTSAFPGASTTTALLSLSSPDEGERETSPSPDGPSSLSTIEAASLPPKRGKEEEEEENKEEEEKKANNNKKRSSSQPPSSSSSSSLSSPSSLSLSSSHPPSSWGEFNLCEDCWRHKPNRLEHRKQAHPDDYYNTKIYHTTGPAGAAVKTTTAAPTSTTSGAGPRLFFPVAEPEYPVGCSSCKEETVFGHWYQCTLCPSSSSFSVVNSMSMDVVPSSSAAGASSSVSTTPFSSSSSSFSLSSSSSSSTSMSFSSASNATLIPSSSSATASSSSSLLSSSTVCLSPFVLCQRCFKSVAEGLSHAKEKHDSLSLAEVFERKEGRRERWRTLPVPSKTATFWASYLCVVFIPFGIFILCARLGRYLLSLLSSRFPAKSKVKGQKEQKEKMTSRKKVRPLVAVRPQPSEPSTTRSVTAGGGGEDRDERGEREKNSSVSDKQAVGREGEEGNGARTSSATAVQTLSPSRRSVTDEGGEGDADRSRETTGGQETRARSQGPPLSEEERQRSTEKMEETLLTTARKGRENSTADEEGGGGSSKGGARNKHTAAGVGEVGERDTKAYFGISFSGIWTSLSEVFFAVLSHEALPSSHFILAGLAWTAIIIPSFVLCDDYPSERIYYAILFYLAYSCHPFWTMDGGRDELSLRKKKWDPDLQLHCVSAVHPLPPGAALRPGITPSSRVVHFRIIELLEVFRADDDDKANIPGGRTLRVKRLIHLFALLLGVSQLVAMAVIPSLLHSKFHRDDSLREREDKSTMIPLDQEFFLSPFCQQQLPGSYANLIRALFVALPLSLLHLFEMAFILLDYADVYDHWRWFDLLSTSDTFRRRCCHFRSVGFSNEETRRHTCILVDYAYSCFTTPHHIRSWSKLRKVLIHRSRLLEERTRPVVLVWLFGTFVGLSILLMYALSGEVPLPSFYYLITWMVLVLPPLMPILTLSHLTWRIQRRHFGMLIEEVFKLQEKMPHHLLQERGKNGGGERGGRERKLSVLSSLSEIATEDNRGEREREREEGNTSSSSSGRHDPVVTRLMASKMLKTLSRMLEVDDETTTFFGFQVSSRFLQTLGGLTVTVISFIMSSPLSYSWGF